MTTAIISVQWSDPKTGKKCEKKFRYDNDGNGVKVKQMLEWTEARKAIMALAEENGTLDFGDAEFLDQQHGYVEIDPECGVQNEGIYRVQIHFKQQKFGNSMPNMQNIDEHLTRTNQLQGNCQPPAQLVDNGNFTAGANSPLICIEEPNNTMQWDEGNIGGSDFLAEQFDSRMDLGDHVEPADTLPMLLPRRKIDNSEKLVRFALDGNTANAIHLGQFYDSRTGTFIEDNSEFMLDGSSTKNAQFNETIYGGQNGGDDPFELLGIGLQQRALVLTEPTTSLNGFSEILTKSKTNEDSSFSLFQIVSTKVIEVDPFEKNVEKYCFGSNLPSNATHLLTSISYGAAIAFKFTINNTTGDARMNIKEVQKIVRNKQENNFLPRDITIWNSAVRVQVFADKIFNLDREISFMEALRQINQLPGMIKNVDRTGLGHPLLYGFVPLEKLVHQKYLTNEKNRAPAAIEAKTVEMMAKTRELFEQNEARLDALSQEVQEFAYSMSEELYNGFMSLLDEVDQRWAAMLKSWRNSLQQMPAESSGLPLGNAPRMSSPLPGLFGMPQNGQQQQQQDCQQQIVNIFEQQAAFFGEIINSGMLDEIEQKCKTAEWLRSLGVPVVGRGNTDLASVLAGSTRRSQFAFFHNSENDDQTPQVMECLELFKMLISEGQRCIYVDTGLTNSVPTQFGVPNGSRIVKFWKNSLLHADYIVDSVRKLNTCLVRTPDEEIVECANKMAPEGAVDDNNNFELDIPCPRAAINGPEGNCASDDCRWECDDCGQIVMFQKINAQSKVEYFHCKCGKMPVEKATFRCKDVDQHGAEFVLYKNGPLNEHLFCFGEKNLLILGESGVGKSTWINAFANFITFGTMDDAIQAENPLCLIPTSFTIFKKSNEGKMEQKMIKIGPQDINESLQTGQSQTKMPKAHVFDYKTGQLRKIDTPGIADTAGMKQDEQNFKYTLRYIATLKELHGIAILMDANRSRLTPAFKYCIGQLLTHLHKDAAKNIVFVFTKCGQERDPGEALVSLRTYLEDVKKNNGVEVKTDYNQVYIMENDAFKFVHKCKHGVVHTEEQFGEMERSWNQSRAESTRLLKYIVNLKAHKPMDTFSLNQARTYIMALAQPLAKISQAIQSDITVLEDKKDWLADLDANQLDLETTKNAMKIQQNYYEIEKLNYPRTVCAASHHVEIVSGQGGQQIIYKTICHAHCGLSDVPPETSGCRALKGCTAMGGHDTCRRCGCHYNDHIHIRFLQHLRTKLVDDPNIGDIKSKLEKTQDKKTAVEELIILLEKRVDDQRREQSIISKQSAKLAAFLKRHALMTYNDAIEEYVQLSIDQEKQIAAVTGDLRKVEGLEDCLRAYREEKSIIVAALMANEEEIAEIDVQTIYGELINLEINGKNIKEMFDAEIKSQREVYDFSEQTYGRPNGRKATKNRGGRPMSSYGNYNFQQNHYNNPPHSQQYPHPPFNGNISSSSSSFSSLNLNANAAYSNGTSFNQQQSRVSSRNSGYGHSVGGERKNWQMGNEFAGYRHQMPTGNQAYGSGGNQQSMVGNGGNGNGYTRQNQQQKYNPQQGNSQWYYQQQKSSTSSASASRSANNNEPKKDGHGNAQKRWFFW